MFAKVLHFEVSQAVGVNEALQGEVANIIMAIASHDLTRACLKPQPGHFVLFTILGVPALPHGVALELIWVGHKVVGRGDAGWVRHLVARYWDISYSHHLRLLLLCYLRLRLWLRLGYGMFFGLL